MLKTETLGLEAHDNFFCVLLAPSTCSPHANSQEEFDYSMSALPSPSRKCARGSHSALKPG